MSNMTINADQRLFVLKSGGGYTCLGFDVAFKRLKQYAQMLRRPEPEAADIGTAKQYQQYLEAERAYIATKPTETLYDADTPAAVQNALEAYRKSEAPLRVFYGDVKTGRSWMDEYDMVGTIGRSMGPIRIPLLVPKGQHGGCALLSARIIRIVDAETKRDVYRHPQFHLPKMDIVPETTLPEYVEAVLVDGSVHARFRKPGQAAKWIAFMQGDRMSTR